MSDLFPYRRRSSTHKSSSALARNQPKAVQVWVKKNRRSQLPLPLFKRVLKLGGLTVGLIGAGGFVVLCLWTSVVFILRPNPPRWLAQTVPYFSKSWSDQPIQSLEEIEAELQAQGQTAGDLNDLSTLSDDRQLDNLRLLPVLGKRSSCTRNCEAIVELRLYGVHHRDQQGLSLQLLDQLAIQGPPEEQIVDPVWQANVGIVGSTHPLPLTEVKSLQEEGLPGVWLTLTGRWQHQGSPILYGQVLHVDLQTLQINSLLNWSSPPGRLPVWQDLDGEGLPEMVVSQSVGLEPHFSLYTIANTTAAVAVRLKEISLSQLPLPQATYETQYHNALFLAQHGLWSNAQTQLTELKTQLANQWSQELEQQFQLVTLHARVSQSQAERDWSRPRQKLLALLLDGRWEKALEAMGTSQIHFETAVLPLLQRDSSRLWQRLTASLQVTPTAKAARIWGALLLLAKEDKESAIEWLTQNQNAALKQEFETLVAKIQPEEPEETEPDTSTTVAVSNPSDTAELEPFGSDTAPMGGIFGTARLLASPNPNEWRQPPGASDLILSAGQQWYEVTLQAGNINQRWSSRLELPGTSSPEAIAAFWRSLGFGISPVLHLVEDASETPQTVQVEAIQWRAGTIKLLASGTPTQSTGPWAATTPDQWVTPRQIRTQSLAELYQERPQLGERVLATLSNHLGVDTTILSSTLQEETAAEEGLVTVRRVDFTGDQEIDLLLTLDPQAWVQTDMPLSMQETVSMIVSSRGELLFSNLWEGGTQTLMGWLTPDAGPTALVVNQGGAYQLLVWSPQQQQFR